VCREVGKSETVPGRSVRSPVLFSEKKRKRVSGIRAEKLGWFAISDEIAAFDNASLTRAYFPVFEVKRTNGGVDSFGRIVDVADARTA